LTALLAVALAGCATEPSTKQDVCASFDELSEQIPQGNGFIGNPLFNRVKDLADVASRYEGEPDLSGDAADLKQIGESDSTTILEIMNATDDIAQLCGHPLGLNL
jgi:hypothetical protein